MGVLLPKYTEITLTAGGGTVNISPNDFGEYYNVSGTVTLTSSWTIQYDGASPIPLQAGMRVIVLWKAIVNLNGNNITFLGNTLPQKAVNKQGQFTFEYDGSNWQMFWSPDFENEKDQGTVTTLTAGGGTINLNPDVSNKFLYLIGSPTLSSSWTVQTSGTPQEGDNFMVFYNASTTLSGNNITIFGFTLSEKEALYGKLIFIAKYVDSTWRYNKLIDSAFIANYTEQNSTVVSISAGPYTAGVNEFILVNATTGSIQVNLPAANLSTGKEITVKKTDVTVNTVVLDGNGVETIDGTLTKTLTSQWDAITVVSNGTAWFLK